MWLAQLICRQLTEIANVVVIELQLPSGPNVSWACAKSSRTPASSPPFSQYHLVTQQQQLRGGVVMSSHGEFPCNQQSVECNMELGKPERGDITVTFLGYRDATERL